MPSIIPAPDTTIYLCRGVLWDSDYTHVRLFDSEAEKLAYLQSTVQKTVSQSSYQPINKTIRVPFVKDAIQNCDYLYFVNTGVSNKYYYAFITGIDFVNFNMSEIHFEIDYFQSYFSQAIVGQSFVEREIVLDDTFGKNVIPEQLETGEYVYNKDVSPDNGGNLILGKYPVIVMAVTEDIGGRLPGTIYDGIYNGLLYYGCTLNNVSVINTRIDNYMRAGKANAIISIFMYPGELLGLSDSRQNFDGFITPSDTQSVTGGSLLKPFATLNGYKPKNNKLYCYPFRALCVWGSGGGEHVYRYEHFADLTKPLFKAFSALGGSAPILCVPLNYNGFTQAVDEACSMPPYPLCSWLTDNYQNWLAQNQMSQNYNVLKSAISGVMGGVGAAMAGNIGGVVGAITTPFDTIAQSVISREQHKLIPDSVNGNTASTASFFANGEKSIYVFPKCIKPEQAKKIDDFFSMYGYAVNELKIPAIRGRKYWNYVKTKGANIYGNIPVEAVNKFVECFDRGITFWHTNDVYNYALNNSIL